MSTFTKICGIAFIVFSTSAYGWVLSRDLKRRLLELRELKKIMFLLRGEIGYGMTPLLEAAGSIAQRVTAPFNGILVSLSNRNSEIKECPFGQMWEEEFTKGLVMSHLSAAEKERLVALGNSMGLRRQDTAECHRCIYAGGGDCDKRHGKMSASQNKTLQKSGSYAWSSYINYYNMRGRTQVEVGLIFKIAAVGILVSVIYQVLKHSGREEQAFLASLAGLVLVLFWILPYISALFEDIKQLFTI